MGDCVIGIDAGGTMTKAALFDLSGRELACARSRNVTTFPNVGWTERDPDAMWAAAAQAISDVLSQSGVNPKNVLAVSASGYGSGIYYIDRDGNPVVPGIVSTDTRSAGAVAQWTKDGLAAEVSRHIDQSMWPGQSLALMGWFQKNRPEVVDRIHQVVFCKDFLRGRLCGDFSTDFTDAGSAGLIDVVKGSYSTEALKALGLNHWVDKLPQIGGSADVVGGVSAAAATQTGLIAGTPVVRGTVDMSASAMASMITTPKQMSVVAGTFSIATTLHETAPKRNALPFLQFAYPLGGYLAVEGTATSASNLEWVVKTIMMHGDTLKIDGDIYDVINAAVKRGMGVHTNAMFFPFLFGGPEGAPAGLVGMTARTDFDKVMTAIFEGIVFAHKADIDKALTGPDAAPVELFRLTGGASRSPYWADMFADILGRPVEVPQGSEFGALGTAMCAATGAGAFGSLSEALSKMAGISRRHEGDAARGAVHLAKYPRYCALRDAMASAMLATEKAPQTGDLVHA